jgi:two-component sensor histidine kinase
MEGIRTVEGRSRFSDGSEQDHRISNSLSIISSLVHLKAKEAKADCARQILLDVAGRIDTVARLHRLLAQTDTRAVPIGAFLGDVCSALKALAADDNRVKVAVEIPGDLTLPSDVALRLGLLTGELFSNSVKYAHPTGVPTIITVACLSDRDGALTFSFEDDGIGFPENFDPTRQNSLGMKILAALGDQLGGHCEWQDLGIGLRFTCRIPAVVQRDVDADACDAN